MPLITRYVVLRVVVGFRTVASWYRVTPGMAVHFKVFADTLRIGATIVLVCVSAGCDETSFDGRTLPCVVRTMARAISDVV
jgi:hypothetical protein